MLEKEKLDAILDYCSGVDYNYGGYCKDYCKIASVCEICNANFANRPECIELAYKIINNDSDKALVEHPNHYNREDAMECIDEMIEVFGTETVISFCLCNIWKYRYRAADKNGIQDLKKSDWYMKKYIELREKLNNDK